MADPEENGDRLEPTLDIETSPSMELLTPLTCTIPTVGAPSKNYWQAQNFATKLHIDFFSLQEKGNISGMRKSFFLLARYYGRTLGILRDALRRGNTVLINVALRNLIVLHQPLYNMRDVAPTTVPFVVTLNKETRKWFLEDLIKNQQIL